MDSEWVLVQILNLRLEVEVWLVQVFLYLWKSEEKVETVLVDIPVSVCSDGHGCTVDAVVGVIQGFLVSGNPDRWASLIYPSSATIHCSTQDEHSCEMRIQVWCVTVKQHFQLQLQVILFGWHYKKVEFTHF